MCVCVCVCVLCALCVYVCVCVCVCVFVLFYLDYAKSMRNVFFYVFFTKTEKESGFQFFLVFA